MIKYNEKREVIPDLAEKWEISPDGKTYKFYLKKAKWQDGKDLGPDDVIFTLSLIKNPKIKSPLFAAFSEVEVKKEGETLYFFLKTPLASFLHSLNFPILPKHILEKEKEILNSNFAKKPIGSGPFKLKKIKSKKEIFTFIFLANPYYEKRPYLSKVILKFYPDLEAFYKAKKENSGFLNQEGKGLKISLPQYTALFFNLNSDLSSSKNFRKALSFATDKEEIKKGLGWVNRLDFPILPGFLGYKEGKKYEPNQEEAKRLLSQVKRKEFSLVTNTNPQHQKVAEILKSQWEKIGLKPNLRFESEESLKTAIKEKNYDIILVGENVGADPDPYPFWHSSFAKNGLNLSGFQNKRVDKLLEEGRTALDENSRKERYEKFVEIISEEIPAIFLYQSIYYYKTGTKIKGVKEIEGVNLSDRFWNIEEWYIKTKKVKK